jgi:F0F1-type ATP synthase assembly protein I
MKNKLITSFFDVFSLAYCGGVIAGIGFGIIIANGFVATSDRRLAIPILLWFTACICLVVGSLMGRSAQNKSRSKKDVDEKHDA